MSKNIIHLFIYTCLIFSLLNSVSAEENCFEKTPKTSNDVTPKPSGYDVNHINYYFLKKGYY
ncbi:MAG: hypothetical protein HQL46_15565 [Gammaproteobacteria bacterium]|nr:hypothetical protein [Gammaproteobacteria bacterium]